MRRADLALKNGRVATPHGLVEACIAIEGGKVAAIAKEPNLPKADETIDIEGRIAVPGLMDSHTHICMPGRLRDSFETGSKAAAMGGVTTVVEMPALGEWMTTTVKNFSWKRNEGERLSLVDFALYAGEIQHNEDLGEISDLVGAGAVGFKITMGGDTAVDDDGVMLEAMRRINESHSLTSVHAENNQLLKYFKQRLIDEGRSDVYAHPDSRPEVVEVEAVSRAVMFAGHLDSRLHVCHLSTLKAARLVREARGQGTRVTAETCPHYLVFDRRAYREQGPNLMTNPPLRERADVEGLWAGLARGDIDTVSTDHCAYLLRDKGAGRRDVWKTSCGVPGLETMAALILSEGVNKDRITLTRFVQLLSENPARIFGLYPRKGSLQVGSDADITIIDLKKEATITADWNRCIADYTPYEGIRVTGMPVMTFVRGEKVMEEGEITGKPGHGRFVPSSPRRK